MVVSTRPPEPMELPEPGGRQRVSHAGAYWCFEPDLFGKYLLS